MMSNEKFLQFMKPSVKKLLRTGNRETRPVRKTIAGSVFLCLVALASGSSHAQDYVPVPTARPEKPEPPAKTDAMPAGGAKKTSDSKKQQTGPAFDLASAKSCERALRKTGTRFEVLKPIAEEVPCGARRPLLLKSLPSAIKVPAGVKVRCEVAMALSRWMTETVVPSAELHLGAKVTAIDISTSYQCRRRNNGETGKYSEHAFANGVDIVGFQFEDRDRLAIAERLGESDPDRAFQAAVRGASCAYFTTVIGPTTNANHADHLHLDLAERRNGYRLCQ